MNEKQQELQVMKKALNDHLEKELTNMIMDRYNPNDFGITIAFSGVSYPLAFNAELFDDMHTLIKNQMTYYSDDV